MNNPNVTYTIEEIASRIYDGVLMTLAYDPDMNTLAEARRINNGGGWTIERSMDSSLRGNVERFEGVRVSDDKLVKAHALALSWLSE